MLLRNNKAHHNIATDTESTATQLWKTKIKRLCNDSHKLGIHNRVAFDIDFDTFFLTRQPRHLEQWYNTNLKLFRDGL